MIVHPFLSLQILVKELDDDGRRKLRLAIDIDNDENISPMEIAKCFPPNESIVEQVGPSQAPSYSLLIHALTPIYYVLV